jgi:sialate O-acetylesterase
MTLNRRFLFCCLLVSPAIAAPAAVRLAMPFSDHMVIQAGRPVPVWGTADAGEGVTVELAGRKQAAVADGDGRWRIDLESLDYVPGHAAQTLVVRGARDEVRVTDVLIGEIWLCSGQSNMRFTLGRQAEPRTAGAPQLFPESLAGATHPRIRLLNVSGGTPANRQWGACSPETAAEFSAIGCFFGTALGQARNAPIGLIDLGRGGAAIRAFLPPEEFAKHPEFDRSYAPEHRPGFANGAVFTQDLQPLGPFALRGVLWYQGEGDVARAELYPAMLRSMIDGWRQALENSGLPFLVVQLPPWERRRTDSPRTSVGVKWAELREAQALVAKTVPHTALVVIVDCGERLDIHPRRKREVGERLARAARAAVYGEAIPAGGPEPVSAEVRADAIVLTFSHAEGGLLARGEHLEDFEIAGDDGRFTGVRAMITSHDQVTVPVPPGSGARYVRYAWRDYFEPSLWNGDGWPAAPFRTDTFPLTNAGAVALPAGPLVADERSLSEIAREQFAFAARQYAGLRRRMQDHPSREP